MKFGLLVVIALLAGAVATHFLQEDPGYVVINFRGYLVEMSVPVLLLLILLAVALIWLIVRAFRVPRQLGEAAGRYRSGRAGERLTRGMIEVAEGNFAKGEKLLTRSAVKSDAPLANYLQAARAAHLLGQYERRDNWLRQAFEMTPHAASAVLLTQAELQLDQGQYEQALATLRRLEEQVPNHSHALNLLGRLYYRLEDWEHLETLLPRLRKHGRVDGALLDRWSIRVYAEKLGAAEDAAGVDAAWQSIPKNLRSEVRLLEARYAALIRAGQHETAEKEIVRELKREWRGPLVGQGWLRTLVSHLVSGSHCSQSGHARYSGNSKMPSAATVGANIVLCFAQRRYVRHACGGEVLVEFLEDQRVLPHPVGNDADLGFLALDLAHRFELFDEAIRRLHVDRRRQDRNNDGFGMFDEFRQFRPVRSCRRIDDQEIRCSWRPLQALVECRHTSDGRPVVGSSFEPVQARALRVVVGETDGIAGVRKERSDIRRQRALAAAAFGVHDHDVPHCLSPENGLRIVYWRLVLLFM
jgi:HemY protein